MAVQREIIDPTDLNLTEQVVSINRVTKVVKGGKNMSFVALVVVGDPSKNVVGFAKGKAKEVPSAIRKAIERAKKNLVRVHTFEHTIPHEVLGVFGAGCVLLKPAREGKGTIAGGAVRDIVLLNSAAALVVAGKADDLRSGALLAVQSIDSGSAARALAAMVAITNEQAP